MEGVFSTEKGALRVASIYLPNGNPVTDENLDEWAEADANLDTPGIANGPGDWIPEGWVDPLFTNSSGGDSSDG